ncbi:MAG: nucleoside deaminase [Gammaproteobacteria bacterium]|nr:nucleoside deaminase [Gammaproteobacteria bacterium]
MMRHAIADVDRQLAAQEGGPFGACIVRDGQVVATAHNTVLKEHDPTCHAEMNAIRAASRALGTHELHTCTIYSTTEPCPMCFSAIHWARIPVIVFGTRIADVQKLGFHELDIDNARLVQWGHSPIVLVEDFLRAECLALLQRWQQLPTHTTY